ncbi:hypothetical protein H9P43_006294 [Blastocladiella emersonii ATCC 22665]|nr:hypothetical protein H9P43_006294 [Blastocladiella emersonii ATCC 22665]
MEYPSSSSEEEYLAPVGDECLRGDFFECADLESTSLAAYCSSRGPKPRVPRKRRRADRPEPVRRVAAAAGSDDEEAEEDEHAMFLRQQQDGGESSEGDGDDEEALPTPKRSRVSSPAPEFDDGVIQIVAKTGARPAKRRQKPEPEPEPVDEDGLSYESFLLAAATSNLFAPPADAAPLPVTSATVASAVVPPSGVPAEILDTLPLAILDPAAEDTDECAVCLSTLSSPPFGGQSATPCMTLPCLHTFHEPCARRALAWDTRCPSCRHDVVDGVRQAEAAERRR